MKKASQELEECGASALIQKDVASDSEISRNLFCGSTSKKCLLPNTTRQKPRLRILRYSFFQCDFPTYGKARDQCKGKCLRWQRSTGGDAKASPPYCFARNLSCARLRRTGGAFPPHIAGVKQAWAVLCGRPLRQGTKARPPHIAGVKQAWVVLCGRPLRSAIEVRPLKLRV